MDARAARAVGVSVGLFVIVALVFLLGRFVLDIEPGAAGSWFEASASQWYALPLTILVFTVLSFLGAPQFGLMAAALVAFGPTNGAIYAFIATQCSAAVNYVVGRYFGADILKRYGGDWANKISDFIGRNGLLASMVVRWVPSGPFIVVNMGFGVARTPYWAFAVGTALGSAPKILIVALMGESIRSMITGGSILLGIAFAGAALAWIGIMLVARIWLRRNRVPAALDADDAVKGP
ncbi:putative membrane protein YdjX (TVP38/TMEM64 family) [Maricaulis maris]|uniref:TVP38/TMEM64 family membrane protein n=2 Tax=Maricaulaceae TaxID=2800061 RepID=A0A495DD20_9PROT|nr:putative membrane protein YdjX (TVP38/TMEM64 family) [Maricaulis maris]